jgi:uncharacterized membrane protein YwzB
MSENLGIEGMIQLTVTLLLILVTWRALRNMKVEQLFQIPSPIEARIIRLFIAILVGHGVARFFFDYLNWTSMLKYIGQS